MIYLRDHSKKLNKGWGDGFVGKVKTGVWVPKASWLTSLSVLGTSDALLQQNQANNDRRH